MAAAVEPAARPGRPDSPARVDPHRQPARPTSTALLDAQPDARFVLERTTSMLRHGMSAAELRAAGRARWPTTRGPRSRASRCTCRSPPAPTCPRSSGCSPTWSPPAWATRPHDLGQPPDRRRAGPAARGVPRLHVPPPHRHRPVARRPRRAAGDRHRARRPRGRARRRLRLPRPHGAAGRPPARRQRRHRPRHRPRGPARRRLAQGPGRDPRPRRPRRGRVRAVAVLHRRQAAALRRAPAHAGVDAVPARGRPRARRSATRSTCGCATPRRRSTASESADGRRARSATWVRATGRRHRSSAPGPAPAAGCRATTSTTR